MKKKITMALAAILASTQLVACSGEDLAFGVGVVIGVIIGSDNDSRPSRPGHDHGHGHGGRHGGNHGGHHGGGRRHHSVSVVEMSAMAQLPSEAIVTESELLTEKLMEKFELSQAASVKLTDALLAARESNFTGLQELGLKQEDARRLSEGRMPRYETTREISDNLQENPNKLEEVFGMIAKEFAKNN